MKDSVLSLKEKTTQTLVFLLSNCPQVLNILNEKLVKYYYFLTISVYYY